MGEFLKGECPHCRQPIEYPSEGTGQTVACPACSQSFALTPSASLEPAVAPPPMLPPANAPDVPVPAPKPPPKTATADRFDQAYLEFERDGEFNQRPPTREQIARAWALAEFRQRNPFVRPTHNELVTALREIFPEFKIPRPVSSRSRRS